jgi:Ca2+-binding EF-hand superfamily protein
LTELCLQLTSEEKERARQLFDRMDVNNSGRIDLNELCVVQESQRETMIKLLDVDGDSEVG